MLFVLSYTRLRGLTYTDTEKSRSYSLKITYLSLKFMLQILQG